MYIDVLCRSKRGIMKKFFIFFVIMSFLSVMPSFAVKLIFNEGTDRTVPSRCSGHSNEEEYEMEQDTDYSVQSTQDEVGKKAYDYNAEKYELVYRQILGADIRPELVGTTWGYPVNNVDKISNSKEQSSNTNTEEKKIQEKEVLVKRFLREAADYYYVDTINTPGKLIPAGFEKVIQE